MAGGIDQFEAWMKSQDFNENTIAKLKDKQFTTKDQIAELSEDDIKKFNLQLGQSICLQQAVKSLQKRKGPDWNIVAADDDAKVGGDAKAAGMVGGDASELKDVNLTVKAAGKKADIKGHATAVGAVDKDHADGFFATGNVSTVLKDEKVEDISADGYDHRVVTVTLCGKDINMNEIAKDLDVYQMKEQPRGIALIINNYDFSTIQNMPNREGTDVDAEAMSSLFTQMHFQVDLKRDLKKQAILDEFNKMSKHDHTSYDCFVAVILSHGERGGFFGTDGEKVDTDDVLNMFAATQSLAGKPKLFFVQACQGDKFDKGVTTQDDMMDSWNDQVDGNKVPQRADMLLAVATQPGFYAWRNPKTGSYFIKAIVEVFSKLAHKYPIGDLLTKVNMTVSQERMGEQNWLQISSFAQTLRKRLYFMPGSSYPQ